MGKRGCVKAAEAGEGAVGRRAVSIPGSAEEGRSCRRPWIRSLTSQGRGGASAWLTCGPSRGSSDHFQGARTRCTPCEEQGKVLSPSGVYSGESN